MLLHFIFVTNFIRDKNPLYGMCVHMPMDVCMYTHGCMSMHVCISGETIRVNAMLRIVFECTTICHFIWEYEF